MHSYTSASGNYHEYTQSLSVVRNGLMLVALIACIIQITIDYSYANIFSNILALVTFSITSLFVFHPSNSNIGVAFSATIVFLCVISNSLVPVLGTLLEGNSLVTSMLVPEETFFHRLVFSISLLIALGISRSGLLFHLRFGMSKLGAFAGTNIFLTTKGVIGLGLVGFGAYMIRYLPLPVGILKLLNGVQFLTWAPFILLVPPYSKGGVSKYVKIFLVIYYFANLFLSLSNNSRMGMVGPIAVVGSSWIVMLLLGKIIVDNKLIRKFALWAIAGLFILGQFVDLSTAILVARAGRETRTTGEQLAFTFEKFTNKDELEAFRAYNNSIEESQGDADEAWQENYVQNPFLARFIQVKFDDNSLYRIKSYDLDETNMLQEVTAGKLLVLLPTPILNFLDIKLDKIALNSFSIGDMIDYLAGGGVLGRFLTGSVIAHAFALFGLWYPIVLICIYTLLFTILYGLISVIDRRGNHLQLASTLGLFLIFNMYTDISLDGITSSLGTLIRGIWQLILIYSLSLWILRLLGVIGFESKKKES